MNETPKKQWSLTNKLTLVSVLIAILALILSVIKSMNQLEIEPTTLNQETKGDHSPIINSDGGNVNLKQ